MTGPEAWARRHIRPAGPIVRVHERPWATVSRVPLEDGAAWLKKCAPVQAFEPRLTAALAQRSPSLLPEVVAHDEERGLLLLADAGERLGVGGDPAPWEPLLAAYAELQRSETVHAAGHLAAGVPDRRLESFPALFESLAAHPGFERLRPFGGALAELCDELAGLGLRETIEHADLHGANVYAGGGTQRILDWGDACVSHPFLTLFVTFEHLEPLGDAWRARLRDAYLEPWGTPRGLRDAALLAERLGVVAHVFKEIHVHDAVPPEQRRLFVPKLARFLPRVEQALRN